MVVAVAAAVTAADQAAGATAGAADVAGAVATPTVAAGAVVAAVATVAMTGMVDVAVAVATPTVPAGAVVAAVATVAMTGAAGVAIAVATGVTVAETGAAIATVAETRGERRRLPKETPERPSRRGARATTLERPACREGATRAAGSPNDDPARCGSAPRARAGTVRPGRSRPGRASREGWHGKAARRPSRSRSGAGGRHRRNPWIKCGPGGWADPWPEGTGTPRRTKRRHRNESLAPDRAPAHIGAARTPRSPWPWTSRTARSFLRSPPRRPVWKQPEGPVVGV